MDLLIKIPIFWGIFFIVSYVVYYIIEKKNIHSEPWGYFDTYPYICRKCMTTWSLISIYIMTGLILEDVVFSIFGIILSALYGYGLYKLEKERFTDED